MEKSIRISYTLGSVICIILLITLVFANIYPCGYWNQTQLYEEEGYAGHGYHSLVEVVGNGFFWEADEVPEMSGQYKGDGPYYAMGLWWISVLYIPMFLVIICLGWLIAGGRERLSIFLPGSKKNTQNEHS